MAKKHLIISGSFLFAICMLGSAQADEPAKALPAQASDQARSVAFGKEGQDKGHEVDGKSGANRAGQDDANKAHAGSGDDGDKDGRHKAQGGNGDDGDKDGHKADGGKSLPAEASARAKEVAFGKQGRHERALHAASEAAREEAEHSGRPSAAQAAAGREGARGQSSVAASHEAGRPAGAAERASASAAARGR
jgi:hypothetical protein